MSSYKSFAEKYQKWCSKAGYNFSEQNAKAIYDHATAQVSTLPKTEATKSLITHAVNQLNTVAETLSSIQQEMLELSLLISKLMEEGRMQEGIVFDNDK